VLVLQVQDDDVADEIHVYVCVGCEALLIFGLKVT
jgi:hypothetical protein